MKVLSRTEIETAVRELLKKYHAEAALLFGSYARNEATPESDIDLIVFGGDEFEPKDIFSFAEDLADITGHDADVYEICEVNKGTAFYDSVMQEGVRIA